MIRTELFVVVWLVLLLFLAPNLSLFKNEIFPKSEEKETNPVSAFPTAALILGYLLHSEIKLALWESNGDIWVEGSSVMGFSLPLSWVLGMDFSLWVWSSSPSSNAVERWPKCTWEEGWGSSLHLSLGMTGHWSAWGWQGWGGAWESALPAWGQWATPAAGLWTGSSRSCLAPWVGLRAGAGALPLSSSPAPRTELSMLTYQISTSFVDSFILKIKIYILGLIYKISSCISYKIQFLTKSQIIQITELRSFLGHIKLLVKKKKK